MNAVLATPSERLAVSRERLRIALRTPATPGGAARAFGIPTAWLQHPLQEAAAVAVTIVGAALQPIAQRHPFRLVLGAGLIGGLLVCSRPWRWLFKPAVMASLVPAVVTAVMKRAPLESWLAMIVAAIQAPRATDPPPERP